jgi:hypothetical protein
MPALLLPPHTTCLPTHLPSACLQPALPMLPPATAGHAPAVSHGVLACRFDRGERRSLRAHGEGSFRASFSPCAASTGGTGTPAPAAPFPTTLQTTTGFIPNGIRTRAALCYYIRLLHIAAPFSRDALSICAVRSLPAGKCLLGTGRRLRVRCRRGLRRRTLTTTPSAERGALEGLPGETPVAGSIAH